MEKIRLLYVEDVPFIQMASKLTIDKFAMIELETVDTGEEALCRIKNKKYDFILMDLGLPKLQGIEVTEKIRNESNNKTAPEVPIFALTAYNGEEIKNKCMSVGMNGFLEKPLIKKNIEDILKKYFNIAF